MRLLFEFVMVDFQGMCGLGMVALATSPIMLYPDRANVLVTRNIVSFLLSESSQHVSNVQVSKSIIKGNFRILKWRHAHATYHIRPYKLGVIFLHSLET